MNAFTEVIKLEVNGCEGEVLCELEGTPEVGNLIINGRTVVDEGTSESDIDSLIAALQYFKSRYFPKAEREYPRVAGTEL